MNLKLESAAEEFSPPSPYDINLEIFRTHRQDALASDGTDHIRKARLTEIEGVDDTEHNHSTIVKADDIFACAKEDGNDLASPLPDGRLIHATLVFEFDDSLAPHRVEVSPPHTIKYQDQADAPRVLSFLARQGLLLLRQAHRLAIIAALALLECLHDPFACLPIDPADDRQHTTQPRLLPL